MRRPSTVSAWSARACDLRAVAAATRRLDHIIAQRFADVAQRCGRADDLSPHRVANCTLARSRHAPENWRARE
eukprot:2479805-Lingulodinium_polyedra.AAC.1